MTRKWLSRAQAGFSILEVLLALVVVTGAALMAAPLLTGWQRIHSETSVERQVRSVARAIGAMYETTSGWADAEEYRVNLFDNGEGFDSAFEPAGTGPQSLAQRIPQPITCRTTYYEALQRLSSAGTTPPGRAFGEPAGSAICLLVSPRHIAHVMGYRIPYHDVAVVSPGPNGKFHPDTTFDFERSALVLKGDDQGELVGGRATQEAKTVAALEQLMRVRDIYEDYFTIRYLSDPGRNVGTDFFYIGYGGNGGDPIPGALVTDSQTDKRTAMLVLRRLLNPDSRTAAEVNQYVRTTTLASPWGNQMEVANRPGTMFSGGYIPDVRAPGALGPMGSPPWSAVLGYQVPGGGGDADTHLLVTALGRY